ncbi:AAA family ATPase [Verrucomicrobium spinosum]|uniref:AAA family ATPase n=1 Tax=Verrucomicrobium spinosum TaxID=2736 RepID=UPI0001746A9E|nr:AAA family ATPase [Verrucomicrobium spinosum]
MKAKLEGELFFQVLEPGEKIPKGAKGLGFLQEDRWDDWGQYSTQFYLTIVDDEGKKHDVGQTKIGQIGLKAHHASVALPAKSRSVRLPRRFSSLDEDCFSLGQDDHFYDNLNRLGSALRRKVLRSLRDVAADVDLWKIARDEAVMERSLMRSITATTVERHFRRIAKGGARLTDFSFKFSIKSENEDAAWKNLEFEVIADQKPPTNVHALIGRNGVGKTTLIDSMVATFVNDESDSGSFEWGGSKDDDVGFSNLVKVSFSAFDSGEIIPRVEPQAPESKYTYIGLREDLKGSSSFGLPKDTKQLAVEFVDSLEKCGSELKRDLWLEVIQMMGESEPLMRRAQVAKWIDLKLESKLGRDRLVDYFDKKLSSGHKIVLLTMTRLVEKVEERTLVLIDEPEAHLHPPLVSAFIRAISHLLLEKNGVAIVATHSPVVLQEVPKSCVWILNRVGESAKSKRPSIETFGENVGTLTHEVFKLDITSTGFYSLVSDVAKEKASYRQAVRAFGERLGGEARAMLKCMYLEELEDD